MRKWLFYLSCLIITSYQVKAQPDAQFCITTDKGIFTVSKTTDGKDMIMMSVGCWNEIVTGTKYISSRLSSSKDMNIYLQLADKRKGCNRGIGFGCGIFDRADTKPNALQRINQANRVCAVSVKIINGSVRIVFNDEVKWETLRN